MFKINIFIKLFHENTTILLNVNYNESICNIKNMIKEIPSNIYNLLFWRCSIRK